MDGRGLAPAPSPAQYTHCSDTRRPPAEWVARMAEGEVALAGGGQGRAAVGS